MGVLFYNKFGMDFYFMLNCFFIYSFLGWAFECIVMSIEEKTPVNRGFVRGPLCTVYGLGALMLYFLFQPLAEHKVLLFVCGSVFATVIEIVTAKLMTMLFGDFWWNYDNKRFNYRGVICLESSLCWGLMTVLTFMFFQPFIESIVSLYYERCGKLAAMLFLAYYCVDFSTCFYKAYEGHRAEDVYTVTDALISDGEEELAEIR